MKNEDDYEDDYEDEGPSKTEIKKQMHQLTALGERIAKLPVKLRNSLNLDEELMQSMHEWDRIKSHEAKRRHLQFIGKLIRKRDVDQLKSAVDTIDSSSDIFNKRLHELEKWRDRLLSDDTEALPTYINAHPHTDTQQLRQILRKAQKEKTQQSGMIQFRKLFQFLKNNISPR